MVYGIIITILSFLLLIETVFVIFNVLTKARDIARYETALTRQKNHVENIWQSYSKVVEDYNKSLVERAKSLDETNAKFEKYEKEAAEKDALITEKDNKIVYLTEYVESLETTIVNLTKGIAETANEDSLH